jgi:hypothetical protein
VVTWRPPEYSSSGFIQKPSRAGRSRAPQVGDSNTVPARVWRLRGA